LPKEAAENPVDAIRLAAGAGIWKADSATRASGEEAPDSASDQQEYQYGAIMRLVKHVIALFVFVVMSGCAGPAKPTPIDPPPAPAPAPSSLPLAFTNAESWWRVSVIDFATGTSVADATIVHTFVGF
jgi:hypothetical protein